ncbi:MAG: hypothetical protein M3O31_14765 [Acidobacteriota bacterium]|nr:hypothetical protein [Acidobacteriota bacterium]
MASLANTPIKEASNPPTIEERRALIDRVAASAQFARSARLRDFLLYVGGQSLKEGCPEIHEQEIGAKVFGRSLAYDRSQDNIVRVNATELRKRIELYFATEGAHEPLILEIPRGGYRPFFRPRLPIAQLQATPVRPAQPTQPEATQLEMASARMPHNRLGNILWAIACAALSVTCLLLYQQDRAMRKAFNPWDGKPAVASLWGDFLDNHQQTDVVLPDDSLSVTEDLVRRPVSLEDYLSRNYMRQIQSSDLGADRKADLDQLFAHNLVTFGGVRAAELVLNQIPVTSQTDLTLARYYVADSFKRHNVILIGGKKANPWVHLFDEQLNFITDYDDAHSQAFVSNRNPKPGEQALYPVIHDSNALVGYATIAYLANPGKTGSVIILAGTDSDATCAAAEFLTSNNSLQKFMDSMHAKSFPYFEILLKTSRLSGTSFSSQLLAYRTYPGLR